MYILAIYCLEGFMYVENCDRKNIINLLHRTCGGFEPGSLFN